jgi:ergothioneine biosynthesis protein EgtB
MPLDDRPGHAGQYHPSQTKLESALSSTRGLSREIAEPLSAEDQVVQANEDASPAKWHLAHTTWFFEELVLKPFSPDYAPFDERFSYCFNSYYESLGPRHPRARRGLLTRPSSEEVLSYRVYVDEALSRLFQGELPAAALDLIEIGINHEQQHQELMLTDILALFASNPLRPAYREAAPALECDRGGTGNWMHFAGGVREIGHAGTGFAYDNESPRHEVLLRDFQLFSRPVTNGEWMAFMADGGYTTPSLWLADGWACLQREQWQAPGYWEERGGLWHQMTLHGLRPVEDSRPVTHVSYYEADAFARWAGHRLPTEFEWEAAAERADCTMNKCDLACLLPKPVPADGVLPLLSSGVWEWTQSAYLAYPGYKPLAGPLGEYNGKFMCNQTVLRGGSLATPGGHIRPTYRNFFYPHQRWQFMGLRLASDA